MALERAGEEVRRMRQESKEAIDRIRRENEELLEALGGVSRQRDEALVCLFVCMRPVCHKHHARKCLRTRTCGI